MKHVVKGLSPASFERWKSDGDENWQPSYGDLPNPEKRNLHEALVSEQGFVCCYCGRTISLSDSHIEHFRPQGGPQGQWRHLDLSYENLFASCGRGQRPGDPQHCGMGKGGKFDESLCISPIELSCEQRFLYMLNGAIGVVVDSDAAAKYMSDLLRLDIDLLRSYREQVLARVFPALFLETATDEEFAALRDGFRRLDDKGKAFNLGHVLARFAEQRLADRAANQPAQESG